jgi:hypothetical protein
LILDPNLFPVLEINDKTTNESTDDNDTVDDSDERLGNARTVGYGLKVSFPRPYRKCSFMTSSCRRSDERPRASENNLMLLPQQFLLLTPPTDGNSKGEKEEIIEDSEPVVPYSKQFPSEKNIGTRENA